MKLVASKDNSKEKVYLQISPPPQKKKHPSKISCCFTVPSTVTTTTTTTTTTSTVAPPTGTTRLCDFETSSCWMTVYNDLYTRTVRGIAHSTDLHGYIL